MSACPARVSSCAERTERRRRLPRTRVGGTSTGSYDSKSDFAPTTARLGPRSFDGVNHVKEERAMARRNPHLNLAARMGRWSAAHWKTATFGWLAFVVVAFGLGGAFGTKTIDPNTTGPG